MKITIIALVATLCLAGVSCASFDKPEAIDVVIPEDFAEDVADIEAYGIFSGFYGVLKVALRTLKGANCTIKQVVVVRDSAQDFVDNIQACGTDATAAFKNVIAAVQNVITTCNNIINLNENVCNNDESTDGTTTTSHTCFVKLLKQLVTLRNQIKKTLTAIKKVPAVPADAATCTSTAVSDLTSAFTSFPANVKTCSILVS